MSEPLPIKYTCLGPMLTPASYDAETQKWTEAERTPCGADVSPLIAAVEQDGADHTVTCAQCGTTISVKRTPPEGVGPSDGDL